MKRVITAIIFISHDIYENAFSFTNRELMNFQFTSIYQIKKLLKQGAYSTTKNKEEDNKNG